MPKQEGQKSKLLTLLRILEQKTDEEHLLNVPQLVELLEQQDILAERKSIYSDIDTLRSLGSVSYTHLLCEGTTVIRNAERLRLKESDRIAAMEAELRACGGVLESEGGTITVHGCANRLHAPASVLHGHNDHRVVCLVYTSRCV